MKNLFIVATLLCSIMGCSAQNKNSGNKQNQDKMLNTKTFDIEEYKKITQKNSRGKRYIINSNGIVIEKDEDFSHGEFVGFREDCHYPDSPYNTVFLYYKNGVIKKSWTTFYNNIIGDVSDYDSLGFLTNRKNYDIPYKFDVKSLIDKMKKEYGVDLLDKKRVFTVHRFAPQNMGMSYYEVVVYGNHEVEKIFYYVDGNTGETLFQTRRAFGDEGMKGQELPFDEYLRKLSEKGAK